MNKPRVKGTMAESAVVAYLRGAGFPWAERRSLKGSLDQGDVTGTPGLCWEVKYANAGLRLSAWMSELGLEVINAKADFGLLVVKPNMLGAKSTGRWYAAMHAIEFDRLKGLAPNAQTVEFNPFSYTAGRLAVELVQARVGVLNLAVEFPDLMGMDAIGVVTPMPPGTKGQPQFHFKVMYLEDAVRLLRAAGYGEPHEDASGVS